MEFALLIGKVQDYPIKIGSCWLDCSGTGQPSPGFLAVEQLLRRRPRNLLQVNPCKTALYRSLP